MRVKDYEKAKRENRFKNLFIHDVYDTVFHNYKYNFNCENGWDDNYVTEKLITPIFYNCLTFYSGTTTVNKHIDPICYVPVDLDKPNEAYAVIEESIKSREWEKRKDKIKEYLPVLWDYCNVLKYIELIIKEKI
jgi:hypothetical protein